MAQSLGRRRCRWIPVDEQFTEFSSLLEDDQPRTLEETIDLLWDRYGVTHDRTNLASILRTQCTQYAKPRIWIHDNHPWLKRIFVATAVRKLPVFLVVRPYRGNRQTARHSFLENAWFLRLRWEEQVIFREKTAKEDISGVLEAIREQNSIVWILLIADNDGGHHAKLTQKRADELDIEFGLIAPYSLTLNAIEPL